MLVVPAIAALTAATYEGRDRALAYALLGGIAAVAVAAGPLIGGWVTTEFTWRYVFAGRDRHRDRSPARAQADRAGAHRRAAPKLDGVGVALSSIGLGLIVFAILQSSVWGFVQPRTPPTIGGTEITPLGFSPVPFWCSAGSGCSRPSSRGSSAALASASTSCSIRRCCGSPSFARASRSLLGQQLVLMGSFFVIPVYLQVVLGLDAFETGKRLIPLSVAMLVFALLGPRIAGRRSPRTVAQAGLVAVSIGAIVMLATLDVELNDTGFKVALALIGAGAGLLASQLGNVIMSSVAPEKTSEGGGLQGTAQNLGSSLGTALIGAVLLASLATGFSERIADNPDIPEAARTTIAATPLKGSTSCRSRTSSRRLSRAGSRRKRRRAVASDYSDAQLEALRLALGAVALAASAVAGVHGATADGIACG